MSPKKLAGPIVKAYKSQKPRVRRLVLASILGPDKELLEVKSVRLAPSMWDELDEISEIETEERNRGKRKKALYSRNDVIVNLLKFALARYWEGRGGRPQHKGNKT